MVFHVGPNVSRQTVDATAKRLGLTVVGVQTSGITGGTLYHFSLPPGRQVADVVRSLETERVGIASPNYVYRIVQDTASDTSSAAGSPEQYTVEKLRLAEVHKVATGRDVLVAVIDSKVDAKHPDLAGAIVEHYDAVGRPEQAHSHGTGMAGAIVSHRKLLGIAPGARILAVHAFCDLDPAIAGGDHAADHRRHRMGDQQGRAHHQYELRRPVRSDDPARDAQRRRQGRHPDRRVGQHGREVAAALSGRRSARDRGDGDRRERHACSRRPCAGRIWRSPRPASTSWSRPPTTPISSPPARRSPPRMSAASPRCCWSDTRRSMRRTVLEVLTSTARNLNPKGRDDLYGWGLIDPAAALQELDSRIADGKLIATAKPAAPKAAAKVAATAKPAAPKTAAPKPRQRAATATAPRPARNHDPVVFRAIRSKSFALISGVLCVASVIRSN